MSGRWEAPIGHSSPSGGNPPGSTGAEDGPDVVGVAPNGSGSSGGRGLADPVDGGIDPSVQVGNDEVEVEAVEAEVVDAAGDVLLADVGALIGERDEYLGALQRVKADFDNYRKRVLRQQEEQATRAARDLVAKLLPVLDTLDLAEAHLGQDRGGESHSHEATALAQARAQLVEVLSREGLERVDETEVAFDPAVHDAVAHAPAHEGASGEDGTRIDEVLRSGYRWHGQTLRPAMVRVRD